MIFRSRIKNVPAAQAGFSLPEFAIVLAIMGTVLSALWGVVAIVHENMKRQDMAQQMVAMVSHIRNFYASRVRVTTPANETDATSITHYLVTQNVMLPEQIRDRSAGTFVVDHPWGSSGASGAVLASGGILVDGWTDSSSLFRIRLSGLKFSTCVALADKLTGSSMPSGLTTVIINGGTNFATFPVSPDDAVSECDDSPSGDANIIDFIYTLRQQDMR